MNTKTLASLCLLLICTGAVSAQEIMLQGGGASLSMDSFGRVNAVSVGGEALPVLGAGGFSVSDFVHKPQMRNIVANPGFETDDVGWSLNATQSFVTDVTHSGERAAFIHVPGPTPASSSLGQTVSVKPNTKYYCELWLRRENVGVCGSYISERDDAGKLTGAITQIGRTIPKDDGVWHRIQWDIVTQPQTTRLNIRADIYRSTGKLWLDDFFIAEIPDREYVPLAAEAKLSDGAIEYVGELPGGGIELEASFTGSDDAIHIDGEIFDTTGEDRAVAVRFSLPVDAAGWSWQGEPGEYLPIQAGQTYSYTYACRSGEGQCSIYPCAALNAPLGQQAGLTIALPLSQGSRTFIIQHDQRNAAAPATSLTFYFGLTAKSGNHPSRAPFSFVIYSHDAKWGMRSSLETYYAMYPESFVKRPTTEAYLNYANLETVDAKTHEFVASGLGRYEDASDFGEFFKFLGHVHGCYDFRMIPYDNPERPDDDTVRAELAAMVEAEKEKPRGYVPTAETLKKLTYGPNGEILYIGDTRYWRPNEGYNHNDWAGWGLNFRVNEDPDISPHLREVTRSWLEEYAQDETRRPWDACVTADAIEGYMANRGGPDFRDEHIAVSDLPLSFSVESLKPAIINTIWDFLAKAWWPLTEEYQVATYGNSNSYEQFFTMPYIDIPMIETEWDRDHPGRFERYIRATAHHKIWRHWRVLGDGEQDPISVRRHFARCLASAIYPATGALHPAGASLDEYRDMYRTYVPAVEELSIAGWEPVPYARTDTDAVIERYGAYGEGELHFTLRNYDRENAVLAQVSIDREALGIPADADLVAVDIVQGSSQGIAVGTAAAESWRVEVPADGARACWVGTREQMAQHGFRLAGRTLGKIERAFTDDISDECRQSIERAVAMCETGQSQTGADALQTAETLQQSALGLLETIQTGAPVDLWKLVMRTRAELSFVSAGVAGFDIAGPRIVENAMRGGDVAVPLQFGPFEPGKTTIQNAEVMSPWSEVADGADATVGLKNPAGPSTVEVMAKLPVPAEPQRQLMPYAIEVQGQYGNIPARAVVLIDARIAEPLTFGILPDRAFRGRSTSLELTVRNNLQTENTVTVKLTAPARTTVEPAEFDVQLPAGGTVTQTIIIIAEEASRIGENDLLYESVSADARLTTSGRLRLRLGDPVSSADIQWGEAPVIDGKLDDAVWQRPADIPELVMLRDGKPATQKTSVWLSYDENGLYVAWKCAEADMPAIKATITERGGPLYQDDDVELFVLVPGAVAPRQFAVNPLGTTSDNAGNTDEWQAAAQRQADGWTVEMVVPYEMLGSAAMPARNSQWAVQFGRQEKPAGEVTAWTSGTAFNVPENFGTIVFK